MFGEVSVQRRVHLVEDDEEQIEPGQERVGQADVFLRGGCKGEGERGVL